MYNRSVTCLHNPFEVAIQIFLQLFLLSEFLKLSSLSCIFSFFWKFSVIKYGQSQMNIKSGINYVLGNVLLQSPPPKEEWDSAKWLAAVEASCPLLMDLNETAMLQSIFALSLKF